MTELNRIFLTNLNFPGSQVDSWPLQANESRIFVSYVNGKPLTVPNSR